MNYQDSPIASLPADTARLACAILPNEHPYLAIGDRLEPLLDDINLGELYPSNGNTPLPLEPRLLLVTIILQYMEGLSDRQVAEQLPVRIDWKYALRLPLAYPGVGEATLTDFRRRLTSHRVGLDAFQLVLARLVAWKLCQRWDGLVLRNGALQEAECM